MSGKLVIVESPAKAKTINKYLGKDFTVLASFGHIRDLPPKDGSVRPDDGFAMDWELGERAKRPLGEIVKALKGADAIYLATDPDREGEAIAWHIREYLHEKNLVGKIPLKRVTFNEITRTAVAAAIANPRDIDQELVDAYLARRALDYLVGFSLSPVLWRKLPGAKSAGRVQSVALRLISERESEIEKFKAEEYWTIEGEFTGKDAAIKIPAHLTHLNGQKLDKFAIGNEKAARDAVDSLANSAWSVASIERKQVRRNPYAPFTTSTLQQEASRKLYMSATQTMRTAQQLYEGVELGGETVGLITYMRTDGVTLSNEAIEAARALIGSEYGKTYLPDAPRVYKSTAKNAQEAHEAIRPTDLSRRPEDVAKALNAEQLKLYRLIWQRTLASQMASAVFDQVAVDISTSSKATFRATGSVLVFDGFLKVYAEEREDSDASEENRRLPDVTEGQSLALDTVTPEQHFTQPPPRFSEASLVKTLEELGIGRPSTYASIMQVLQDRSYVSLDKRRFTPSDRGRLVTAFLSEFFPRYVQYDFTADLEAQLDDISGGRIAWKKVLSDFWTAFSAAIGGTKDLKISDVIDALDESLGPHFFPPRADGSDSRLCPTCRKGRLGLRLGKFGAFIGCSGYPECKYTRPLAVDGGEEGGEGAGDDGVTYPRELGADPATGLPVTLRKGPYGTYIQLGPKPPDPALAPPAPAVAETEEAGAKPKRKKRKKAEAGDVEKPKRVSLPKTMPAATLDLETALKLLALPRQVGEHPETAQMIYAGIGRFGPYLRLSSTYKNLTDDDVLTIGLNRAVVLLAEAPKSGRGAAMAPLRTLGNHPEDDKPVTLHKGRYGPYVRHGKTMASLTKDQDETSVTLEQAVELINAKIAKGGGKPVRKAAVKAKVAVEKPANTDAAPPRKRKGKTG